MRWVGRGTDEMEEERNVCRVLVGKPGGKTPLRWLRHIWEDGMRWI
jgi:hypothetical protein